VDHVNWPGLVEAAIAFLTALTALISWLNNQHLRQIAKRNESVDEERKNGGSSVG